VKNIILLSSIISLLGTASRAIKLVNETREPVRFHMNYEFLGTENNWQSKVKNTTIVEERGSLSYSILDIMQETQDYIKSHTNYAQLTASLRTVASINNKEIAGCYEGAEVTKDIDITTLDQSAKIILHEGQDCTAN